MGGNDVVMRNITSMEEFIGANYRCTAEHYTCNIAKYICGIYNLWQNMNHSQHDCVSIRKEMHWRGLEVIICLSYCLRAVWHDMSWCSHDRRGQTTAYKPTSVLLQDWPDLSSHIVIAIESLELTQSVQQDDAIQSIFVMYNFLPQFCQSAQDQCTQALPKQPGIIPYNHVVVSPCACKRMC